MDNTHCRIGARGMTESTRCAVVAAMRFMLHDGQTLRPYQEKATRNAVVQPAQRAREAMPANAALQIRYVLSSHAG